MPDTEAIPECMHATSVSGSPAAVLVCNFPPGHEGLHWDATDDITWKDGEPDA
jgi:hypothetical protein